MTETHASSTPPDISIILPVFNVGDYVAACLESLLGQDFDGSFELILIDDKSTDNSLEVCREFAARHPQQIRLIACETNGGVSVARNIGLEQARGTYIMFVDPDDLLPPLALASLYGAALAHDADIVKGNLVLFSPNGERPAPDRIPGEITVTGDEVLTTLYEHRLIRGHVGGKMFRRTNLGDLRLTPGVRMAQDLLFFSEMFARAQTLVLIPDTVYRYRKHAGGSTGGKYQRGSYRDWLAAVENCGIWAQTSDQRRAHLGLVVRTLAQIVREAREIDAEHITDVLQTVDQTCRNWDIRLPRLLRERVGLRSLIRYAKLQLALRQIRAAQTRS